jgi:hypothetical protein
MAKYKALLGEKFDKSKVTVVGSPTITSDGVASGFSGSNFIRVPIAMQNAWKIQMKATFTNISDVLSPLFVISNFNRIILGNNGTITIFASEDNATAKSLNFNNIVLSINKDYLLTFEFDGVSTYTFTAKDLNTNTEYKQSVTLNSKFYNSASSWAIGSDASRYVRGSIDLTQFKIYVDGELVYSPTKPTYLLERRKPKVWNKGQFTVVGNPSISDDGIASGFSSGSYLTIPSIDMTQPWEGHIDFSTTTLGTASGYINWGGTSVDNGLVLSSSKWLSFRIDLGRVDSVALKDNTKYSCVFGWSGTQYYLKVLEYGTSEWKTTAMNSTTANSSGGATMKIGLFGSTFYCLNSLNLKTIKFYQNNTLVFDGGAETYVYDPSKFTVVGTPTITEYGVASGFSGNNYIKIGEVSQPNNNFKAKIKIRTSTLPDTGHYHFINSNYNISGFSMKIDAGSKRFVCYLSSDGKTNDIGTLIIPMDVSNNTDYWLNLSWDGQKYEFSCSTDGINFSNKIIKESDLPIYTQNRVYSLGGASYPFTCGSINLPDFSITVDNKEAFTGAKENYYMLNGI